MIRCVSRHGTGASSTSTPAGIHQEPPCARTSTGNLSRAVTPGASAVIRRRSLPVPFHIRGRQGGILTPPIACVKGEQTRATSVSAHPAQPLRRVGTSAAALGHVAGRRKRQTAVSIVLRRRQPRRVPVSAASDPWLQAHQRGARQQRHVGVPLVVSAHYHSHVTVSARRR